MLMILDGWGINPEKKGNAVAMARTPVLDDLAGRYPTTRLHCAGEAVGLPAGVMGNSEVGHLNIGAGRVVYQDLVRINKAIEGGAFFENRAFLDIMSVRRNGSALHLMGLASASGVHSDLSHLEALLETAARQGVERFLFMPSPTAGTAPPTAASATSAGFRKPLRESASALCHHLRPLLCDGPGQAVGPYGRGLRSVHSGRRATGDRCGRRSGGGLRPG